MDRMAITKNQELWKFWYLDCPYGRDIVILIVLTTTDNHFIVFNISWFLRQFATRIFFLSLLKAVCHYQRRNKSTYGVFSIFADGQGHLPLPKVKVVTFLWDKCTSVTSRSRQTIGAHGCLISSQKVNHHIKVEQLFARRPRRGLVLKYKRQTSRLVWARIHLGFTRAWGPLVVGKESILSESSSKHLRISHKKCIPQRLATLTKKQCAICMVAVSRYVRPIFSDTFVY
jgi:hypothetical protein